MIKMNKLNRCLAALLLAGAIATPAMAGSWEIDGAHSSVGFSVRHMMISNVKGTFKQFSGTIEYDGKDASKASVDVTIQTSSVDTGNEGRDKHLRNPDFFDAEKFPTMTFKSTKIEADGDSKAKITGDLTLHGVTKPVTLDVERLGVMKDKKGKVKAGFAATATVIRSEFGVKYNKVIEAGGVALSDEVKVTLDIEASEK